MVKRRCFSLYDIEEYLKENGAEKVSEKAVLGFESELEETVRELLGNAQFYANYAGRKRLITNSDIVMALESDLKPESEHDQAPILGKVANAERRNPVRVRASRIRAARRI
jgi:histone H3/H4